MTTASNFVSSATGNLNAALISNTTANNGSTGMQNLSSSSANFGAVINSNASGTPAMVSSSPFSYPGLNGINSMPTTISLLSTLAPPSNFGGEERSMMNWRVRYPLTNTIDRADRKSIASLPDDLIHSDEEHGVGSIQKQSSLDHAVSGGSPLPSGIVGIQAFSKISQKRRYDLPNMSPNVRASSPKASSPSLQAILDAPVDYMSPQFLSNQRDMHSFIPALSPALPASTANNQTSKGMRHLSLDNITSIRILQSGNVEEVINVNQEEDIDSDATHDYEQNDEEEVLQAASNIIDFANAPLNLSRSGKPSRVSKPKITRIQREVVASHCVDSKAAAIASVLPTSGNGSGTSCHQCKSRRGLHNLIYCSNIFNKKSDHCKV